MANPNVFCNTPWYEAHIYWDGSLGICCQESQKLYSESETQYNIKTMSLAEWFNSVPVKKFRLEMFDHQKTITCSRCYNEQALSGTSRRHRSNQKSVIFTKTAFAESFKQSPGYTHFAFSEGMGGITDTMPIDLHIDLGNHCNLACKMCWPGASTRIASQYVKWGMPAEQYLGVDWTKDSSVWERFMNELVNIPKLKNLHFMGGETLLSPRFKQLVEFMAKHNRYDVCFSFVTNGTIYDPELITLLSKFQRVGIEISIETVTEHNDYVRQGSNLSEVLNNIKKYMLHINEQVSVTLRPAISALTIGNYYTLLEWCLDQKLLIKSLMVTNPQYLHPAVLPYNIRQQYKSNYLKLLDQLSDTNIDLDFNESDVNKYQQSIKQQIVQVLNLLDADTLDSSLLTSMFDWCRKWDKEMGFDLYSLYPEFKDLLDV
jgi:sulfatase maturation enzyme AslB (radical SAM superfamily)